MCRFMIIFAVFMCFAVSTEAGCVEYKDHWYSDVWYRCCLLIKLYCPIPEQNSLAASIEMYDYDEASSDDDMGKKEFAVTRSGIYDYGITSNKIVVRGTAWDGAFGGNVEPYLKITHNCGGSGKKTEYKAEHGGRYLRHTTVVGTLNLKSNKLSSFWTV